MRHFLLLCVMVANAGWICAQAPKPKPLSAFERELINNQQLFIQTWRDMNTAAVKQAVSDDFKGISENGDFYDKKDLAADVRHGLPAGFRIYDVEVVRLDESCAVVVYNEIHPGEHMRYRHMSDTWSKEGGQWKLKFRQLTANLWSAVDLD